MDPGLIQRAEAVFEGVLALPPAERDQAARALCGGDDALEGLVRSLVAAEADAGFMREPAARAELPAEAPAGQPLALGRYRVLGVLGEGGMGTVYEAEQDVPRRRVALKVMRAGIVTRELFARFRREAELLGLLQHPGIAAVYDAGTARPEFEDGPGHEQPFIAMELVRGRTLTAASAALPIRERLELFVRVCDAAEFAHAHGIVHRDLKPSNVVVGEDGQPKILDFGVASVGADAAGTLRTETGRILGTLAYMAPEQCGSGAGEVDRRADVYALGAILFEMLSGRTPHDLRDRPLVEAARIIRDDDPSRLGSIHRTLRGDLETIAAKALERDPARRYPTAAALAADVRRHLSDEPIVARPASTMYQLAKFARRNRALVLGVSAAFLALSAGLVASMVFASRESDARRSADAARTQAEREAYRANLAAAQSALLADDGALARHHLDRAHPALRGWEHRLVERSLAAWTLRRELPGGPQNLVFTPPDGARMMMTDGSGGFLWLDPATLEPAGAVRIPAGLKSPVTGGTRTLLAGLDAEGRITCFRLPAAEGEAAPLWTLPGPTSKWPPGITGDGRFVTASAAGETAAIILDAATGSEVRRVAAPSSFPPPALTPDGRTLVCSMLDTRAVALDWATGEVLWRAEAGLQSLSADGALAVLGSGTPGRATIRLVETRSGRELGRVPVGGSLAWGASRAVLRPDGQVLAVAEPQGYLALWDARTFELLAKLPAPDLIRSVRYDGGRLVAITRAGDLLAWPASVVTAASWATPIQAGGTATAISPSGAWALTADWGSFTLWDTGTLRPLWRRSVPPRSALALAFDGEDRALVQLRDRGWVAFDRATAHEIGPAAGPTAAPPETPDIPDAGGAVEWAGPGVLRVATPEGVRELRGSAPALAACRSPDGSRVVAVCRDGSAPIWDTATGELVASLRVPTAPGMGGLAAVNARFRGPDTLVVAHAWGVGTFEATTPPDATARDRELALRARPLVDTLFRTLKLAADVQRALDADPTLSKPLRAEAIALTRALGDHAATLNSDAWGLVAAPGRPRADCERAVTLAEHASAAVPQSPLILNTLAVAQYRAGRPADALATIATIESLGGRRGAPDTLSLVDLAIATLAAESTHDPRAADYRRRLNAAATHPDNRKDAEGLAFAREAGEPGDPQAR